MVGMEMKVSVISIWISHDKFNGHAYSSLTSNFLYKIHSNALPFEHVELGGNGKLWIIFLWSNFYYHGNDMVLISSHLH